MAAQTVRLTITPLAMTDAPELFAVLDHPEVGTYLGGPDVESLPWLEERIARLLRGPADPEQRWLNFVVRLREEPRVIVGRLEATTHGDWAEVAWVLGPGFWGQRYGSEGAAWLLDHLAIACGIRECWATAHPDNAASLALMRGLGFHQQEEPWARQVESYDVGDVVMARLP
jgi:RimJ/RimL family protein N-acetyltransferase